MAKPHIVVLFRTATDPSPRIIVVDRFFEHEGELCKAVTDGIVKDFDDLKDWVEKLGYKIITTDQNMSGAVLDWNPGFRSPPDIGRYCDDCGLPVAIGDEKWDEYQDDDGDWHEDALCPSCYVKRSRCNAMACRE